MKNQFDKRMRVEKDPLWHRKVNILKLRIWRLPFPELYIAVWFNANHKKILMIPHKIIWESFGNPENHEIITWELQHLLLLHNLLLLDISSLCDGRLRRNWKLLQLISTYLISMLFNESYSECTGVNIDFFSLPSFPNTRITEHDFHFVLNWCTFSFLNVNKFIWTCLIIKKVMPYLYFTHYNKTKD